eukprot:SAG11_NODE_510_length_8851_cov_25.360718_11_plen_54_part_00
MESEMPLHTYRCTCAGGSANNVCQYDFTREFDTECSVMESSSSESLVETATSL